jgi:hypothetical protein
MEVGMTPEEQLAYNELNNAPVETTALIAEIEKEEQRLRDITIQDGLTGEASDSTEPEEPKLPSGAKYIRSGDSWQINPKHYARESTLKEAGFLGGIKSALGGFTDSRDFYVEDVTQKWGVAGFAGFGKVPGFDSSEENLDDIWRDVGDVSEAAANITRAGAQAAYHTFEGNYGEVVKKGAYMATQAARLPVNVAQLERNAGMFVTSSVAEGAAGLVNDVADSLGGYSSNGLGGYSSNGLGDGWDRAADIGEGVGKFVRGTARGLAPEALTEGVDNGIGALSDKFMERPLLYTGMALAAAPLLIPGIGGAYAKNIITLAGGAIDIVPRGFKALTGGVSAIASGVIDGGKQVGNSIATSPSKRGTAASRRRSRRR